MHVFPKGSASFALILLVIASGLAPTPASANPDLGESGRLLAILLDAGRGTVAANQPLINDAGKGAKGFTPDVFEKELIEKFRGRSGVGLGNLKAAAVPETAKSLLPELVEASKKTVADNQAKINQKDLAYKRLDAGTFRHAGSRGVQRQDRYLSQADDTRRIVAQPHEQGRPV